MLKPLAPTTESHSDFVVCDIENKPNGEVYWIDTAWRLDDGQIVHVVHRGWGEWWAFITKVARDDKKFRVIYAHNGGGWDWLSLTHWLLTDGKHDRESITAICAGSKMVLLNVRRSKKFTIHLCDSLQLLRSDLDSLGRKFVGRGKVDTGGLLPFELYRSDPERHAEYARRDTELVLEVLESALEILRENVAPIGGFGYTIGSTAMRVFRTIGLDYPITIPWKEPLKEILRNGYVGGRVEVFRTGYFPTVRVYDINSLYPSVMLDTEVPISDRGWWIGDVVYPENKRGVFTVTFHQRNEHISPVLLVEGCGAYSGTGTFYHPELNLLREVDPDSQIWVHRGYVFLDNACVFDKYVERLYNLRLSDPSGPLSLLCKYLLNSLYGKFGQKPIREQVITVNSFAELFTFIRDKAKIRTIDDDRGVYGLEVSAGCSFEHVGIAGTITSEARCRLFRGILAAGNVVYCDTDSVHVVDNGLVCGIPLGKEIGKWKLEFEGEGVYCGKKLYALRNGAGTKIRCKGVSVGGRNGSQLGFADLVDLAEGKRESIVCEYKRPATPRQVFTGSEPCRFERRTRTIRMTADDRIENDSGDNDCGNA